MSSAITKSLALLRPDQRHPRAGDSRAEDRRWALDQPTTAAITTLEYLTAILDIFFGKRRFSGVTGLAIFASGLCWMVWARLRGRDVNCRCFGNLSRAPAGRGVFVRNGLFILVAIHQALPGFAKWRRSQTQFKRVTVAVLITASVAETFAIGYLLILLAALRRSKQGPTTQLALVQPGAAVPHFEVLGRAGMPVDLTEGRGPEPLLVLVGAGDCEGCKRIFSAVQRYWDQSPRPAANFAFIWLGGVPGEPVHTEQGLEPRTLVGAEALRWDWEYSDLYGATQGAFGLARVPVAIVLDGNGRVLERPALGQDASLTRWQRWAAE